MGPAHRSPRQAMGILGVRAAILRVFPAGGQLWLAALCFAAQAFGMGRAGAADDPRIVEGRNLRTAIYARGSTNRAVTLSVDRLFNEKRRAGFFRVRLLPLIVLQGVRIEIASAEAGTNLASAFQARLAPMRNPRGPVEWRGVSIYLGTEPNPRLEARRIVLAAGAEAGMCDLEELTLQTEDGRVALPRARMSLKDHPGRVFWGDSDAPEEWDLFTTKSPKERTTAQQPQGTS